MVVQVLLLLIDSKNFLLTTRSVQKPNQLKRKLHNRNNPNQNRKKHMFGSDEFWPLSTQPHSSFCGFDFNNWTKPN